MKDEDLYNLIDLTWKKFTAIIEGVNIPFGLHKGIQEGMGKISYNLTLWGQYQTKEVDKDV